MRQNLSFWREALQAPSPILDCIEHGYYLPLKHVPPSYVHRNHNLTELRRDFIKQAVHDLLENHCILNVDQKPRVCSPLSVVSNSMGKHRLDRL